MGQNPVDETYGYAVYMGNDMPASRLPVKVLRNDTSIQAAIATDKKNTGAVFYSAAAELKTARVTLYVSDPCTVLIEEVNGKLKVPVCDAQMNEKLSKLTVNCHDGWFGWF